MAVNIFPFNSRLAKRETLLLHFKYDFINVTLLLRKLASGRESASDIGCIAVEFSTSINKDKLFFGDTSVILAIVKSSGVGAGGNDGVVRLEESTKAGTFVQEK